MRNTSPPLTARELETLRVVCETCGNKAAAERLCVSETTIKNHLTAVYRKLQAVGAIKPVVKRPKTPACVWLYWATEAYRGRV